MTRKAHVCGRLFTPHGGFEGTTTPDVCGEESGHDESLEPTPHKGRWTGMTWTTHLSSEGKTVRTLLTPGMPTATPTTHGTRRHGPMPETARSDAL